jgi:hypothetical protein
MRKRRTISVFGMSFLDVMFCGFGSVILLVMIVNANAITKREELHEDLRGEVDRIEREVLVGKKYLVELRLAAEDTRSQRDSVRTQASRLRAAIRESRSDVARLEEETVAKTSHINSLQSDLKSLDERAKGLQAELDQDEEKGTQVREFIGTGDRQYLTGIKMGGDRILILVDASASMLDQTVVNIIRRRNLSDASKRASRKWQQALKTVDWLASQLPATSKFQIVTFNVLATPVTGRGGPDWFDAADAASLDAALEALRQVVPGNGTSLHRAFAAAKKLEPRPDNIFLLTDGLPTQGTSKPFGSKVSSKKRVSYFHKAVRELPAGVPVNTVLFPMEGDPLAASEFWKMTRDTNGSLISPSKDWP